MIDEVDRDLTFLAEEGQEKMTRTDAVIWAQLQRLWSTPEANAFIEKHLAGRSDTTVADCMNCLKTSYKWQTREDPIPRWRENLNSLAAEKSSHVALKKYCDFILRNEPLIEDIARSAADLDEGLQLAADEAREDGS